MLWLIEKILGIFSDTARALSFNLLAVSGPAIYLSVAGCHRLALLAAKLAGSYLP